MRAIVQRVQQASVNVDGKRVSEIKEGLLVFLGVGKDDSQTDLDYLLDKIINLRIFEDDNEKMNLSLWDINGELLVVSQFTLYGDVRKGRRPSFSESASPEVGEKLYKSFIEKAKLKKIKTQAGIFGAHMKIDLINDGPVTILLDSKKNF